MTLRGESTPSRIQKLRNKNIGNRHRKEAVTKRGTTKTTREECLPVRSKKVLRSPATNINLRNQNERNKTWRIKTSVFGKSSGGA